WRSESCATGAAAAQPGRWLFSSEALALLDLRGAVVVVDVLGRVIAARRTFAFAAFRDGRLLLGHDRRSGRGTAGAHRQQEIPSGKFGFLLGHGDLLMNCVTQVKSRRTYRSISFDTRGVKG